MKLKPLLFFHFVTFIPYLFRVLSHNLKIIRYPSYIAKYQMLSHQKDTPSKQRYIQDSYFQISFYFLFYFSKIKMWVTFHYLSSQLLRFFLNKKHKIYLLLLVIIIIIIIVNFYLTMNEVDDNNDNLKIISYFEKRKINLFLIQIAY